MPCAAILVHGRRSPGNSITLRPPQAALCFFGRHSLPWVRPKGRGRSVGFETKSQGPQGGNSEAGAVRCADHDVETTVEAGQAEAGRPNST